MVPPLPPEVGHWDCGASENDCLQVPFRHRHDLLGGNVALSLGSNGVGAGVHRVRRTKGRYGER